MEKVKIIDISLSKLGFVVLLQSLDEDKTLPIFIGMPEAQAIAVQYNNIKTVRPLTHDLLKNILTLLNCSIDKVIIDDYKEHTYYAKVFFETEDHHYQIDSRPSDAIALALKFDVPIFVEKNLMENYSIRLVQEDEGEEEEAEEQENNEFFDHNDDDDDEQGRKYTIKQDEPSDNVSVSNPSNSKKTKQNKNKLSKEDKKTRINILRKKLDKSIEEERYEDAAFIRDELKKYENYGDDEEEDYSSS